MAALENGGKRPFPAFGTPVATYNASTWFHANEGTVGRGSLVPSQPSLPRFEDLCLRRRAEQLLKLAAFEHFHHDVGPADELALHIELRDGRPIGIILDALPDLRILQHVNGLVGHA